MNISLVRRILLFLCGVTCLVGVMPIAILSWRALHTRNYPFTLLGLPTLPLLWLSTVFFRRAGLNLEGFARRRSRLFKITLYVVFGALMIGVLFVFEGLGML